jgi:aerobic-type carbon monoxide dehydrogenase small subunit (CoxS/CutS family)
MALKDDPSNAPSPGRDDDGFSVSRRAFLRSVGVTGVAAGVLGTPDAEAQAVSPARLGPGAVPIALRVNGRTHQLQLEPRVTLLDALRDRLDHTGLKRVCDRGSCGACTAIVDGRPVYACSTLAVEAQGKDIRTVEGLVEGTVLHPVQQALCEHDGTMCGFCTPGFVMAAVHLLERNPSPTPAQARAALDGNICRCGTYPQVLEAVLNTKGVRRG